MRTLLRTILLVILFQTLLHSQSLSPIHTQFRTTDSTIILKTEKFNLIKPIKANLNGLNAVLISETHMDSINLKYLRFQILESKIESLKLQITLKENKIASGEVVREKLQNELRQLETIKAIKDEQFDNNKLIHENEILYYKEKAKGKFTAFLLGTTVGAIIVAILSLF